MIGADAPDSYRNAISPSPVCEPERWSSRKGHRAGVHAACNSCWCLEVRTLKQRVRAHVVRHWYYPTSTGLIQYDGVQRRQVSKQLSGSRNEYG
jgi:hypothetical protein